MLRRPGSSWGFVALLKGTSVLYWRWREHWPFTSPTYNSCRPETRTHNLWVTSPTLLPLGHNFHIIIIIIIIIYIYIYIQSISRHFYPKRLTNEDNRSNQNQQKSNKMQVLWQVIIVINDIIVITTTTTTTTMHVIKYSTEKYKNKS